MGVYVWIHVRTLSTVFAVYLLLLVNVSRGQQPESDIPTSSVTDVTSDNDDDPLSKRPGSEFCEQKSICSEHFSFSWPDKNCYCDDLCGTFQDCCPGYAPLVKFDVPKTGLFECKIYPQIEYRFGILSFQNVQKNGQTIT